MRKRSRRIQGTCGLSFTCHCLSMHTPIRKCCQRHVLSSALWTPALSIYRSYVPNSYIKALRFWKPKAGCFYKHFPTMLYLAITSHRAAAPWVSSYPWWSLKDCLFSLYISQENVPTCTILEKSWLSHLDSLQNTPLHVPIQVSGSAAMRPRVTRGFSTLWLFYKREYCKRQIHTLDSFLLKFSLYFLFDLWIFTGVFLLSFLCFLSNSLFPLLLIYSSKIFQTIWKLQCDYLLFSSEWLQRIRFWFTSQLTKWLKLLRQILCTYTMVFKLLFCGTSAGLLGACSFLLRDTTGIYLNGRAGVGVGWEGQEGREEGKTIIRLYSMGKDSVWIRRENFF